MLRLISKKSKILILFFLIFSLSNYQAFAYSIEPVKAVVKSSVCGNGIAEGGEECDINDLNNKNCIDLGFLTGGILTCDGSCHFNSSECINKIVSTPTPQNNPSTDKQNKITSPKVNYNRIPSILNFFGFDRYKKFDRDEIFNIVKMWIEEGKKEKGACDINNDNKCNTQDFAILLYYMKK